MAIRTDTQTILDYIDKTRKDVYGQMEKMRNDLYSHIDATAKNTRREIIDTLFGYIDQTCAKKEDIEDLKEMISHLPTKQDFYKKEDEIVDELETTRQEQTILNGQMVDRTDRIEKLEKIHPSYKHA